MENCSSPNHAGSLKKLVSHEGRNAAMAGTGWVYLPIGGKPKLPSAWVLPTCVVHFILEIFVRENPSEWPAACLLVDSRSVS